MLKGKGKKAWLAGLLIVFVLAVWVVWGNSALVTTEISVFDAKIPAEFDGYRIVQVSDTHDALIGEDNTGLAAAVEEARPDVIVLTGDIVDSHRTDIARSLSMARRLAQIAPTYYVNGNHEAVISDQEYERLTDGLRSCGVTVLEDEAVLLERGGAVIQLIGLRDIGHLKSSRGVDAKVERLQNTLSALKDPRLYALVLAHRPELAETYAAGNADLVLCGHAHGGQARLPLLGGLVAPGQGFFPEYDAGLYAVGDVQMIVSRGIGNSIIPLRVNNRPEIVVIMLQSKQ